MKWLRVLLVVAMLLGMMPAIAAAAPGGDIQIAKSTWRHEGDLEHPEDIYFAGDEVHYRLEITNTSDTYDMSVKISDLPPGGTTLEDRWWWNGTTWVEDDPNYFVDFAPGDIWVADFHYTIDLADTIYNEYWDSQAIVNSVFAIGSQGPETVTASTTKTVRVAQPEISVTKVVDFATSKAGDTVTYTITIANTGDWPLEDISVLDTILGDLSASFPTTLAVGASFSEDFPYMIMEGDPDPLLNTVDVEGTAEGFSPLIVGAVVTDSDNASVDLVHPALTITKVADTDVSKIGDTINYTVVVTNTGDVDLEVVITDTLEGELFDDMIDAGESESFWYAYVVPAGTPAGMLNNTATATGTLGYLQLDNVIGPVTAMAEVRIVVPTIEITKTVSHEISKIGDEVTYTITVTNTGDWALENIVVMDALLGGNITSAFGFSEPLMPGESEQATFPYTIQETAVANGEVVNTAAVTSNPDGLDNVIADEDSATVEIATPGLAITKEADTDVSKIGDTINYTVVVTNTGDVGLEVVVTDTLEGELFNNMIAAGEWETFEYAYVVPAGTPAGMLNNTATATGTLGYLQLDNVIGPVTAMAEVRIVVPTIEITKTVDPIEAYVGDTVTYTIRIENTGDWALNNIVVTDDMLGDLSASFPDTLAVGAWFEADFDHTILEADVVNEEVVNTARVDSNPVGLDNEIWDEDSAVVTILEDYEGLTPGFWKNHTDQWIGYEPAQLVGDVFDIPTALNELADDTLLEALNYGGGKGALGAARSLLRAAVAALLNAEHPEITYAATTAEIIADVNAALASMDKNEMNMLKDQLDMWNNMGGGIDAHGNPYDETSTENSTPNSSPKPSQSMTRPSPKSVNGRSPK